MREHDAACGSLFSILVVWVPVKLHLHAKIQHGVPTDTAHHHPCTQKEVTKYGVSHQQSAISIHFCHAYLLFRHAFAFRAA